MSDRTIIRPGGRKPRPPAGERRAGRESIGKSAQQPSSPVPQSRQDRAMRPPDQAATESHQPPSRQSQPVVRRKPTRYKQDKYSQPEAIIDANDAAGINPVVHLISPLLNVVGKIQCATSHPNMDEFKTYAVSEIANYESLHFGLSEEEADQISYCSFALCCLIDELVLNTPWGISSNWDTESLLMRFHGESRGGDRFYQFLDEMMQAPSSNRNVLQFFFICLELGFEGRYHRDTDGPHASGNRELSEYREKLFNLIKPQQLNADLSLSPSWQGLQDERSPLLRYVPYWVMLTVTAGSLLLVFMGFSFLLNHYSDPLFRHLTSIAGSTRVLSVQAGNMHSMRSLPLSIDPSMHKPTRDYSPVLRSALAGEIKMGLVELLDLSDRIVIRLKQLDLFRSGSDRLSSRYVPLIRKIGQVLQAIDQRVLVTGHSDDVPVRNLRYSSNWDLSKARADSVKAILLANSDLGVRLSSRGLADTFNIVPNNSRENRARNRRVEIVVRK